MKTRGKIEDELREILKQDGLEQPSDQFSSQLTRSIVQTYEKNQVGELKISKWLGKTIMAILLSFNLMFLIYLINFSVQPSLVFSIAAFVLGLWALLGLLKKKHASRIESIS